MCHRLSFRCCISNSGLWILEFLHTQCCCTW
ncbi:hypothetical protein BT93_A0334 [Corymbia citriodora subsp. variegata]|nr:hypothetical protein BT93_A0334 [Corymbia citriodora subsp. variegata]